MRISVLVPSYRRPDLLLNCLRALENQSRQPDEVVVVLRDTDSDSRKSFDLFCARTRLPLKLVLVNRPGQMAALNAGMERVLGEVVCITDDDAEPLYDWISRIESRFIRQAALGGLGGRDHVHFGGVAAPTRRVDVVGKIQWFGRTIGNHAQESVGAREVDCLKGCNMAFRTDLPLRFDERLRGDAYQNEVGICLAVKAAGRKLMYDPEIRVNHFMGARQYGTERAGLSAERLSNNSHNHLLVRMEHMPVWQRLIYLAYTFTVGDQETPGLIKSIQLARGRPRESLEILTPSISGKLNGISTWWRSRRPGALPG